MHSCSWMFSYVILDVQSHQDLIQESIMSSKTPWRMFWTHIRYKSSRLNPGVKNIFLVSFVTHKRFTSSSPSRVKKCINQACPLGEHTHDITGAFMMVCTYLSLPSNWVKYSEIIPSPFPLSIIAPVKTASCLPNINICIIGKMSMKRKPHGYHC